MKKLMKKALGIVALVMGVLFVQSCSDDDKAIDYSKLPDNAKAFIEAYFPGQTATYTERSKDDGTTTFEVTLNSGTQIEFDKSGNWLEVDCKYKALPAGILPTKVANYISENYPNSTAYKVDKTVTGGYQVELTTGLDLLFTADGDFVSVIID